MTDRTLRHWLNEIEVPDGLERGLLAGVPQRRQARTARVAALTATTAACLVVATAGLPWGRLGEGLGLHDTGPGGVRQCRSQPPGETSRTANGLLLEVQPPKFATVGDRVIVTVLLKNIGDRAVDFEIREPARLCIVGEHGTRRGVEGTGPFTHGDGAFRVAEGAVSVAAGEAFGYALAWDLGPCHAGRPAGGCSADEPPPPGDYQVYGSVQVRTGGRLWDLTTQPRSMLIGTEVTG